MRPTRGDLSESMKEGSDATLPGVPLRRKHSFSVCSTTSDQRRD